MKNSRVGISFFLLAGIILVLSSCDLKKRSINDMALKAQRDGILEDYPKTPHDEIIQRLAGNRMYSELQEDFKSNLIRLKGECDKDCAKLVLAVLTPDVGKSITLANNYGIPYIIKTCDNIGIEFIDVAAAMAQDEDLSRFIQASQDNNWSKEGCMFIANKLDSIIEKNTAYKSSKNWKSKDEPTVMGDLPPNQDERIESATYAPYTLKVNKQGFRMSKDLDANKTKQRILVLGDNRVFCPYLDNADIFTELLQQKHPDKEIINAGHLNYTMEDYYTLYAEKARYVHPDIVIVCTSGEDILDAFFTQRNRYSRSKKPYPPSEVAKAFYNNLYGE